MLVLKKTNELKQNKNYPQQLVIINGNWVFLAGTTQNKHEALFSLWFLKQNKFQKIQNTKTKKQKQNWKRCY